MIGGILQHNIGLSYIALFKLQSDKFSNIHVIDKAVLHTDLSFEVRDPENMLQYWVASCRTLGEALIERSMHEKVPRASEDLRRAHEILTAAISKISEIEHPNQWAQVQEQMARCSA